MLSTPHIPLGIQLSDALRLIEVVGRPYEAEGDERAFRVDTAHFSVAVYLDGDVVCSVWYDDPEGRDTEQGRSRKVAAYLSRYGRLDRWEMRLDNGWMRYWYNSSDRAAMVHGLHRDVLRFNVHDADA